MSPKRLGEGGFLAAEAAMLMFLLLFAVASLAFRESSGAQRGGNERAVLGRRRAGFDGEEGGAVPERQPAARGTAARSGGKRQAVFVGSAVFFDRGVFFCLPGERAGELDGGERGTGAFS